jgi:hypothetical protein
MILSQSKDIVFKSNTLWCCQVIINGRIQEVDHSVIHLQRQINLDASSSHEDTTLSTYEEAVTNPPIEPRTTTLQLPTYEEAVMEPTPNHMVAINSPTEEQATIASLPLNTSETVSVNPDLTFNPMLPPAEMVDHPATQEEFLINTPDECVVGNLYIYKGNGIFDVADFQTGDKLIKTQDGLEKLAENPNGATLTITGNFSFNFNN